MYSFRGALYAQKNIVSNVNLNFHKGKVTSIIGPNGSGKSTILKAITGNIKNTCGDIFLNGELIKNFKKKQLAKMLSILPQSPENPIDITVKQLVSYGRYSYQTTFRNNKIEDEKRIEWALNVTNLSSHRNATMDELSGGQRQRAWIAMSLAQNSDCLFLDELTTYLDIRNQIEILDLLKNLNTKENKTIIMVLHDLNHAIHYSDYIVIVKNGQVVIHDSVKNILHSHILDEIFNVKFKILYDEKRNPYVFSDGLL